MESIPTPDDTTELETFINYALVDSQETVEAIQKITPQIWNEWIENGELYPPPKYHPKISAAVGRILLSNADRDLSADNETALSDQLAPLYAELKKARGNPELEMKISRTIRLERLAFIVQEFGNMSGSVRQSYNREALRYNRTNGI